MLLVKELVQFEPDYTLTNCFGQTAAQRAEKYAKRVDIADFLNEQEAQGSLSHVASLYN